MGYRDAHWQVKDVNGQTLASSAPGNTTETARKSLLKSAKEMGYETVTIALVSTVDLNTEALDD